MEHTYAERIFWYHHRIAEEALLLQEPTLLTRIANLRKFFKSDDDNPAKGQAFLLFYLETTTDLCIQFLSINIFLLLALIYIITQNHWGTFHTGKLDSAFESYAPVVVDIIIWVVLSAICAAFFLVLKHRREWFATVLLFTERTVWYEIGAAIIAARFMMLIAQIIITEQTGVTCFDCDVLNRPADHSFGFPFIKMCVDACQAYAFIILPFPQPWAVAFIAVELVRQELRLFSCAHRIVSGDDYAWVVQLAAIMLVLLYTSVLLIPSIYQEGSLRNRFKGDKLRRQAEEIKQEMVVFLSTDVRVPLQYMLHSIATVEFAELTGSSTQPLLKDIEQHTRTVNDVADDLLLLVRIQEKRYTSRLTAVRDLRALMDALVQGVLNRRQAERMHTPAEAPIRNSGAPGVPIRPLRPCFVYTEAPTTVVNVDEKCLVAAVRHLLIFVTQDRASGTLTESPITSFELDLTLEIVARKDKTEEQQALQVVLSGDDAVLQEWSEQRRVHEATTAYICNSIASSCGGTFTSKGFSYTLVIPCVAVATPASAIVAGTVTTEEEEEASVFNSVNVSVANTHAHVASPPTVQYPRPDLQALEAKIATSTEMQTSVKQNRVCVIVDDTVLESVITSAIQKLRLDQGLSILHELQKGDYVPVARLTFVTTYELCVELRRRQYAGFIVLFSGSINYLDDAQVANLDYSLPLPASDAELILFVDWLNEKHEMALVKENSRVKKKFGRTKTMRENTSPEVSVRRRSRSTEHNVVHRVVVDIPSAPVRSSLFDVLPVFLFLMQYEKMVNKWLAATHEALFGEERSFLITRLPPESTESFTMWRWINPSESWRHQFTAQYLTTLPRVLITFVVQLFLIQLPVDLFVAPMILGFVYLFLQYIYRYALEPSGFKLQYFWMLSNFLIDGAHVYAILRSSALSIPTEFNLSLAEFLNTTFDVDTNGGAYVYSQLTLGAYARLYCIYQTHPLSVVGLVIIFVRQSQVLWFVFSTIMSLQMCQFLQLLYFQLMVLNAIYLLYLEDTYRREFKTAHEHILARAFLDQCLDICQHDIRKPLEFLLQRQKDLMQVAVHAGYIRAIKLSRNFLARLEPLHVSGALLSEMAQELTFIRENILTVTSPSEPVARVDHMKTHFTLSSMQLHRAVAGLISSLSSTAESSNVKIYAEVDNKLAVIRVDWKNLSMILTNLVSAALRNIRDFCIETPRNKDLVSYIKIKMVAIDSEAKVPFVHPRVMLINVCDSSNAAAKAAALFKAHRQPTSQSPHGTAGEQQQNDRGLTSVSEITEQRDRFTSQYGRSVCEQLVLKLIPQPVFQTISVESDLQTVQRFTFQYHLTPQTRRAQDFIGSETEMKYLKVSPNIAQYLADYKRIIYPIVPKRKFDGYAEPTLNKNVIYLTSIKGVRKSDINSIIWQFEAQTWHCTPKYILKIPSANLITGADCVVIDQILEAQEGVNICDTVLKLRVCGFNGVVAVVLQEGLRESAIIRDELLKSAAETDLVITAPLKDQHIQAMTVALEKRTVRQLLFMNGN